MLLSFLSQAGSSQAASSQTPSSQTAARLGVRSACLALAISLPRATEITFSPGPGVQLSTAAQLELDAECVEVSVEAFGAPLPKEELPESLTPGSLSATFELGAEFQDHGFEFLEAEAAPARFLRQIGELTFGSLSVGGFGDLEEGAWLRYTRDGDKYSVRVLEGESDEDGDPAKLAALISSDLFATFLLPSDEVDLGEDWRVALDLEQALWMLAPGLSGDGLGELPRALGLGDFGNALMEDVLGGLQEGLDSPELSVEFIELEDRIATLTLEGELILEADLSRSMMLFAASVLSDEEESMEELSARLRVDAELTGSLRYDTSTSLPLGLEIEAEWTATVSGQGKVLDQGEEVPVDVRLSWEGTQEAELTTEAS